MFTDELGEHLRPDSVSSAFRELAIGAEVEIKNIHALRHRAASLMLSQGVPVKAVSAILGHANAAMTLNVFAHLMPGDDASAVVHLDRGLAECNQNATKAPRK